MANSSFLKDSLVMGKSVRSIVTSLEVSDVGQAYSWMREYFRFLKEQRSPSDLRGLYAEGVELAMAYNEKDVREVELALSNIQGMALLPRVLGRSNFKVMSAATATLAAGMFAGAFLHDTLWFFGGCAASLCMFALLREQALGDAYNYADALRSLLRPDTDTTPEALEHDFWGQQLLKATRELQGREPWAIELAIWMAISALSATVSETN